MVKTSILMFQMLDEMENSFVMVQVWGEQSLQVRVKIRLKLRKYHSKFAIWEGYVTRYFSKVLLMQGRGSQKIYFAIT